MEVNSKAKLLTFSLLLLSFCVHAQNDNKFNLEMGAFFRSTAFKGIANDPSAAFIAEKNFQGPGIRLGTEYRLSSNLSTYYTINLRYDHSGAFRNGNYPKDFFIDHNLGIRIYPTKLQEKQFYFVGEVSRINASSSVKIDTSSGSETRSLALTGYQLGFGLDVWEITLETKFGFCQGVDNAYNGFQNFDFIIISAFYKLAL